MVKGKRLKVFGRRLQRDFRFASMSRRKSCARLSFIIVISFRPAGVSSPHGLFPSAPLRLFPSRRAHENVGRTAAFTFQQSNVFQGRSSFVWKASLSWPFFSLSFDHHHGAVASRILRTSNISIGSTDLSAKGAYFPPIEIETLCFTMIQRRKLTKTNFVVTIDSSPSNYNLLSERLRSCDYYTIENLWILIRVIRFEDWTQQP